MKSSAKWVVVIAGALLVGTLCAAAQTPPAAAAAEDARAQAYHHYTLGRLHLELAGDFNRGDHLRRAIDEFKEALKYDPYASEIVVQLAEAYRRSGRIREAVVEARALVEKDPNNIAAHRLLGRIYFQALGEPESGTVPKETLQLAIQEYGEITRLAPDDTDALLDLARLHRLNNDLPNAEATLKRLLEQDPGSEVALAALASIYSESGEYQKAVELLTAASAQVPSSRLLATLAYAYEQEAEACKRQAGCKPAGHYDNAIESYRRALQLDPKSFELRRRLAEALLQADRAEEALTEYQALAEADPEDAEVLMRIAQLYRHQKRVPEAREWLERAKKLDADNLEIGFQESLLYESEGNFDGAIAVLSTLVARMTRASGVYSAEERNGRAVVLERLGTLYRENEKFDESVQIFEMMLALGEDQARRGYAQTAETQRQARRFEAAQATLEQALTRFPEDRNFNVQKAMLLSEQGQLEPALAIVRAELKEAPEDRSLFLVLAQIYERNKRYAEAEAALDKAAEFSRDPRELEDVHFLRGAVLERQKKYGPSEEQFRQALALNPKSAITLNYLGYMLADQNVKLQESVELIKQAVELDPYNGAYLDSLGWAYYRLEKYELAEDYLLRATNRLSRDPTIHDHLGDLYFKTGRLDEAVSAWERAMAAWQTTPPTEYDGDVVAKLEKKLHELKVRLAREMQSSPKRPQQ
ncbi:MAG: tetratricopeptide repeat protein [Acidobacteria bacterium]|nr:tetratricopeptide repeat protein [Acidobacteriota bacterium]